jgi:hypothetical protein
LLKETAWNQYQTPAKRSDNTPIAVAVPKYRFEHFP